jgi:hypothetical protein
MKKVILLTIFSVFVLFLSSCDDIKTISRSYGQLVDISVFDLNGTEIDGEFLDRYCIEDDYCDEEYQLVNLSTIPLNSPAPVDLFYVADVTAGEDYIIQFKIKHRSDLLVKHIIIDHPLSNSSGPNQITYENDDFYDNTYEDDYQYVSILIEDISEDANFIHFIQLMMRSVDEENTINYRGTAWQEGRTYISGLYLNVNSD